jgi:hypothetical protein
VGGNLWKLGRVPRDRYVAIEAEVRAYLERKVGAEQFRIPRWYASKTDFGDMDVVLCTEGLPRPWPELRAEIAADLAIDRQRAVGPLWSTVFRGLQVDYFLRGRETFLSTWAFLCWNDVGNLLGKMYHRLGVKYGEDGLFWVHRGVRENVKREILLTRDSRRAFALLELPFEPWEAGFADLPSLFRWVIASPYFSVEPYVARSASTEKRIADRKTVREFVAFLERERVTKAFAYEKDRTRYVPLVSGAFPEVELPRRLEEARAEEARAIAIDSKLNGHVVMELIPGLAGKELGEFLRALREHRPDLDQVLLAASPEEVRALVLDFASRFRPR